MCPKCDLPFEREQVIDDIEIQQKINNLEAYCINETNGCNWEGAFQKIPVGYIFFRQN